MNKITQSEVEKEIKHWDGLEFYTEIEAKYLMALKSLIEAYREVEMLRSEYQHAFVRGFDVAKKHNAGINE